MKNSASPIRGIFITAIFLLFVGITNLFAQSSSFTISTASQQCLTGNSFSFVNSSSGAGNTYLWNFGDGSTSSATNPTKVYIAAGTYNVQLITTNGSISYYSNQQVIVNPMPVADFATYVNTGNGSSYTFQSTSTIQSGNMNYSWSLGANSSPSTSTVNSPQTTYSVGGSKNVQLTVTSDAGCSNTIIKTINVVIAGGGGGGGGSAPTATISLTSGVTPQCLSGNSFDFDATAVTGAPTFYQWDFPNATPNVSYLANPPAVSFNSAGTYDVKLFVQNAFGTNTYTYTVVVNPIPATPTITSPTTVSCGGANVTLTSSSTSGNQWYLNAGIIGGATNPTYVTNVAGSYTVQVTASGCSSLASNTIVLTSGAVDVAPTISTPAAATSFCAGSSLVLTANTNSTSPIYQWYNNGVAISGATSATYTATTASTGTGYSVKVTNASGCSSTSNSIIITSNPIPTVLSQTNQVVCNNALTTAVNFSGAVSGTIFNWTNSNNTIGLGANGTGNITNFNAINAGTIPVVSTVIVTPQTIGNSSGTTTFTYSGSIQNWTVPAGVTAVTIEAKGAQGGLGSGGSNNGGAYIKGTVNVTPGQILKLLVGQQGQSGTSDGGGGGGSFVTDNSNNPIMIAGGGGGTFNGSTSTISQGAITTCGVSTSVPAGCSGNGGGGSNGTGHTGSGAGLLTNAFTDGHNTTVAKAFINGGAGGSPSSGVYGGFGGGGASITNGSGGGGGGGYSGGACGNNHSGPGGGGGSYNSGINQINTAGTQTGDGEIIINYSAGPTCTGTPQTFTYTVNPTSNAIATPASQTICTGAAITSIVNSGTVTGTQYNWTRDNTLNVTGIPASGSGSISGNLVNTTSSPITVTFMITPTYTNAGVTCIGTPIAATVVVNPIQAILTVTPAARCGTGTLSLSATASAGSTINWYTTNTSGTSLASGSSYITPSISSTTTYYVDATLNGCTSTPRTAVVATINPLPVASFSSSNTSGNNYAFYNGSYISNSAALTYAWSGNNGIVFNNTAAQNPTAVLAVGTTAVSLTVTSAAGCVSNVATQNIVVASPAAAAPNATITFAGTNPQCITGNSFTFGVNSTGGAITTYQWSIPNATVTNGTTATPTAVFTQPGTYNITLTVSNASGSMSTQYSSVTVLAIPNVSFYASNASNVYTFTPNAWVSSGAISSSQWTVTGATTLSPAATPTPQNLVATLNLGVNTITLTVSTGLGCSASYSQTITVAATAIAPVSGITLSAGTQTQCLNGNSYTFSPNVTGGTPTTYQWYFQNGTPSSANTAGPHTVTFNNAGTNTVQLYVTNAAGNSTATYNAIINNAAQPTVSAGGTTYFCSGGSVTLTSSAAASYQWYKDAVSLGVAGQNQTFAATTSGVYTVIVTYANGCTSASSYGTTITVVAAPSTPTITAGGPTTFCAGGNVILTSSAGNSYQWYLNSVAISGATGSSYTATASGNYTVIVTNANGCASLASAATNVTVNPAPTTPVITASGATTFCAPSSVTLSSTAATTYQWYKNGIAIIGATSQNYIADSSKTYTVITGNGGACPSAVSNAITVTANPKPVASYVLYLNTALTPTGATDTTKKCFVPGDDFSYQSSSTIPSGTMTYLWDFAGGVSFRDGTNISYINPRVIFDTAGTYPVKLKVTSDKGCVDSVTRMVYLSDPHAAFNPTITYSPDIFANPTVNVNNASYDYGGILTYSWSTTATPSIPLSGANPSTYTYNSGGVKNINLTVTSNAGCTSSVSHTVNIVITPKAIISVRTTTADVFVPMVGLVNYTFYTVTGFSNLANPSTIVTGSITNYYLLVEYRTSPFVGAYTTYGSVNNADMTFSIPSSDTLNYEFKITLITTSNLGVTNQAIAYRGNTNSGYTSYRGINPNAPIVKLPNVNLSTNMNLIENISVYPNPSRDFVKVNFKAPTNTKNVTIKVISMYGKLVQQQTNSNSSNQVFNLNINNLANGTYAIVIEDENGKIIGNTKMIKAMH